MRCSRRPALAVNLLAGLACAGLLAGCSVLGERSGGERSGGGPERGSAETDAASHVAVVAPEPRPASPAPGAWNPAAPGAARLSALALAGEAPSVVVPLAGQNDDFSDFDVEARGQDDFFFDEPSERPSSSRRRGRRDPSFSANVGVHGFPWSEFDLGDLRENWEEAWRYEASVFGHYPLSGHVEPMAGAYFYFEQREWEDGIAAVDDKVFGLGVELGALLYPAEQADERPVNLALYPFFRLGTGFHRGDFENVQTSGGFGSGDIDGIRFEISGGLDVRLIIARTVQVGLGAGVGYWNVFDISGRITNGGGVIIIRSDELDYEGLDAFVRLQVGLVF